MKRTIVGSGSGQGLVALARKAAEEARQDVEFLLLGVRGVETEGLESVAEIKAWGQKARFQTLQEQVQYLQRRSEGLARHFAYECEERRGIGLLQAWEEGAEEILLVGAHCVPGEGAFYDEWPALGGREERLVRGGGQGWWNVAAHLETESGEEFYPRGYPLELRYRGNGEKEEKQLCRVIANAGFLRGWAEVDALQRLQRRVKVLGWKEGEGSFCLRPGTWTAMGAKNLLLSREAVPGYFLCPYLQKFAGAWAGFVLQRISQGLGDAISVGGAWLERQVEEEDAWRELDATRPGLRRSGEFCEALRRVTLSGQSYGESFGQLVEQLPMVWPQGSLRGQNAWSGYEVDWRRNFIEGARLWTEAVENIQLQGKLQLAKKLSEGSEAAHEAAHLSRST